MLQRASYSVGVKIGLDMIKVNYREIISRKKRGVNWILPVPLAATIFNKVAATI